MIKGLILRWAENKGILKSSTMEAQFVKTIEEVAEVNKAIYNKDMVNLKEEIGDVAVTLVILAELAGLDYDECMVTAYDKISKRQGKMVNGIFVKENK